MFPEVLLPHRLQKIHLGLILSSLEQRLVGTLGDSSLLSTQEPLSLDHMVTDTERMDCSAYTKYRYPVTGDRMRRERLNISTGQDHPQQALACIVIKSRHVMVLIS